MNISDGPFSTENPALLQRHFDALRTGSGLSDEVISERGYKSVLNAKDLQPLGFTLGQRRAPGLLLPVCPPDGSNTLYCYRADNPRYNGDGKALKYEFPRGSALRLDVPPRCRPALGDPKVPLWMTEGQKKADALATHQLTAAALLGVWSFKAKGEFGGVTLLADFDLIALNGRTVNIVFDSDIMVKPQVRAALARLTEHLQRKGAVVTAVYLPPGPNGEKVGVDDYLVNHAATDLEALITAPRPAPKPAEPMIELLDEPPPALHRPLDLVDGRAYAASWLWLKKTVSEEVDKGGEVVRVNPPKVKKVRALFVVRDDGRVYGPGGDEPIDALDFDVHLAECPRDEKLWRASGVKAYRSGTRPDVRAVFERIANAFGRFVDFNLSVADQTTMCEFSACASLITWFAAAFSVLGYFWPSGDKGSGKTKWGTIWAMTSYLGEVILSSGTFAAVRDLADWGAAMLFDDAEIIADPKRCDPNKRELLLAGNRRGAVIPVKEPVPDGGWTTRWVNAFCPRAFTAIKTPDPVLASRAIAIPLVRTADEVKGNADPANTATWPFDHRQLRDDLWATALALMSEAERIWAEFDTETSAVGREFEPWRAILAVARLLERHGVDQLETRMRHLMNNFREERQNVLDGDRTVVVIQALLQLADIKDISDIMDINSEGGSICIRIECWHDYQGGGERRNR